MVIDKLFCHGHSVDEHSVKNLEESIVLNYFYFPYSNEENYKKTKKRKKQRIANLFTIFFRSLGF